MILPMFGLLMALIVVGSLASLVVAGEPNHARLTPYIGYVCLFAGFGALSFAAILTLTGEVILQSNGFSWAGIFRGLYFGRAEWRAVRSQMCI